ncbi:MAG: thiamine diphosphokinase [Lentisphaerae bacterium]|nr:thiamine diphosphokinase [Lentisphaerota bacterium]
MEKTDPKKDYTARTVILANGNFPSHPVPYGVLMEAERVVCCDGAAERAISVGIDPVAVVGDGDSLSVELRGRLGSKFIHDANQDDNDLSKAFNYCRKAGWKSLAIVGATGLREDHTLGNISLLSDYVTECDVVMLTDHGVFTVYLRSATIASVSGQQVSIFAFDPMMAISSRGLKYSLNEMRLSRWWQATLNEAEGESFRLEFNGGPVVVYRTWAVR